MLRVLVTAFMLVAGPAVAAPCAGFQDLDDSNPYCPDVAWLESRGITLGCAASLFCPTALPDRLQIAVFLSRMRHAMFTQGGNAFGAIAGLGTVDQFPLDIYAGGRRVMRYDAGPVGANILGGFQGNALDSGYYAMTIAGGGTAELSCFDADTGLGRECSNRAKGFGPTVGGGSGNRAFGTYSTIAGGLSNQTGSSSTISGYVATIGGGTQNTARAIFSTIGGGFGNTTSSGGDQTIAGGSSNVAIGQGSAIPGGYDNRTEGAYSFAAGIHAKAMQSGCFVWSDGSGGDTVCNAENAFVARASGGFTLATDAAMTTGCSIAAGGGTWSCTSARDSKKGFASVDTHAVLAKVAALPISTWEYRSEASGARHLGPVAEDFRDAFGLGDSDATIGLVDANGVALAAIQGLNAKLEAKLLAKDAEIAKLRADMEALAAVLHELASAAGR